MKSRLSILVTSILLFYSCSNYKLSTKQLNGTNNTKKQNTATPSVVNTQSLLNFPVIQPIVINSKSAIYGFYNSKNVFAKQFPNFLNDGKYIMDKFYPDWDGMNFSNKTYPATIAKSENNLNHTNILLCYGSLNSKDFFFQYAKNGFKNAGVYFFSQYEQFNCPEGYLITDESKQIYAKLNNHYKQITTQYLSQKNAGSITMLDLGSYNYLKKLPTTNTIIFDIRHDYSFVPYPSWQNNFLASHLFTLVVRNSFGDSLTAYHQAIFGNVVTNGLGKGATIQIEFLKQAYTNALPSLINQFLNDEATQKTINAFINEHSNDNKEVANKNIYYGALLSRKRELITLCEDAKMSFESVAQHATNPAEPAYNYVPNNNVSAQTNQLLESSANLLVNLINRSSVNGEKKLANIKQSFILKLTGELIHSEANLLDDVLQMPDSDNKQNLLARIKENSNSELQESFENVNVAKQNASSAIEQSKKNSANYLQQFNNSVQNFQRSNLQALSAASSNGGSTSKSKSCPVADQFAQSENARLSAKANAGNLLQAETKRSQAAIIRKYISACPEAFTPKQRADMEKIAQSTDNEASDLEQSRPRFKN